jgi:hypothetical protein
MRQPRSAVQRARVEHPGEPVDQGNLQEFVDVSGDRFSRNRRHETVMAGRPSGPPVPEESALGAARLRAVQLLMRIDVVSKLPE